MILKDERNFRWVKKYFKPIVYIAVLTIIFGTIYGIGQFVLRSTANDPQIHMAQDAAAKLDKNDDPASVLTPNVDVGKSLAPFTMVYDKQGKLVASSVYDGSTPLIAVPVGVLKSANSGYHAITWQPDFNTHIASVSVSAKNYYVLSGRSLTEVESREDMVMKLSALGWVLSVAALAIYYKFRPQMSEKRK